MWPAKQELGPQLTYGVSGNGLVACDSSLLSLLDPILKFPRLRDHGPHLHLIENTSRSLAPGVPREDIDTSLSVYSTHHKPPNDVNVPEDVAASLAIEARPLRDGIALDPTIGKLATIFDLQTRKVPNFETLSGAQDLLKFKKAISSMKATAFITGSGKLKIMPFLVKKRNVFDTQNMEKLKKIPIDYVSDKFGFETQINWPVSQVVVSADQTLLAVRGHGECCVYAVEWDNDKRQIIAHRAFSIKNTAAEWSDLVFNTSSLAFVDVTGTITIYRFEHTRHGYKHELDQEIVPSIYAPLDWSSWKRLCWPLNANYMILFSRKSAHYIELNLGETGKRVVKKLVTTHYWSHFQDVALVDSNIFLFTSKEIIWLLTTLELPFKRILSWKHYLDDTDASLKLSVCLVKSGTYALSVYSHETPIIIAYTFGTVDGRPCSVYDPYILYESESAGVAHLTLAVSLIENNELSPIVNCVEINCDLEAKCFSFCEQKHKKVRYEESALKPKQPTTLKPLRIFSTRELFKIYRILGNSNSREDEKGSGKKVLETEASCNQVNSQRLISDGNGAEEITIADTPNSSTESNVETIVEARQQIDVVQNYAFELGSELKTFLSKEKSQPQKNGTEHSTDEIDSEIEREESEMEDSMYPQYRSLASFAENIPKDVTNLKEFDSMLHQLNEYCEDQGGRIDFGTSAFFKGSNKDTLSSEYIRDHILGQEDLAETKAKAAVILTLCMVRAHSTNIAKRHKELIEKELESCSEDLSDIFGDWPAQEPESSKLLSQTPSQSQTQQIKHSQPQSQSQNPKGKRGLLHRALTQSSQAFKITSTPKSDLNGNVKPDLSATPKSKTSQSSPNLQPSQSSQTNSQESDTLFISQFQSSQESLASEPFSSQVGGSQSLKRSSQLATRRKKKKKGGFA